MPASPTASERRFRLRGDLFVGGHAVVEIVDGDGTKFCGFSHCVGDCGLPALFLRYRGEEFKAHGSMVACGSVWQRKPWSGERRYVDDTLDAEKLIGMMWW